MSDQDFPPEGYDGPATLVAAPAVEGRAPASLEPTCGDESIEIRVTLRGHFEPIDGRFHWYGRVAADEELTARHASGATVVVTTPGGSAEGRLSDVDPWGRFRISGTGRPPY